MYILFILVSAISVFSQPAKYTQIEDADEHFKHTNYLMAIPIYKSELKKDPDNNKIKYKLGICYLNTKINRDESVTYLEAASKDPKIEDEKWIYLGMAYHLGNRIEDAILAFEKFKSLKPKRATEAERYIMQCDNALKFMRKPSKVTFQNLGKDINSSEPDYYPFIDQDETFLMYTSRRKDNFGGKKVEMDGYRSSDIYQSNMVDGNWAPAKNAGHGINGNLDEQVVSIRGDGMQIVVYEDHIDKFGNLYVASRRDLNSEFGKPKILDPVINENIESSGCFNEDESIIFFARREDLTEPSDLYMCRKLPNSKWAIPVKLPDVINSPYNEDLPFLSSDGQTLYFASDGHNTMGGFDLFKTTWNQKENTFSHPENLGYPINSTDDDRSICVTRDNKYAYVSSFRPNGFGDLDIYRAKLLETEPVSIVYTGNVFMGDTIPANQPKNFIVTVIVTNLKTNYEYTYVPHSKTGRYIMALPAGNYRLTAHSKGYAKYSEDFEVSDMGKVSIERSKNLLLKKNSKK